MKKVRISHFVTKNIEINNQTKPTLWKFQNRPGEDKVIHTSTSIRQNLAKKRKLANEFATFKIQSGEFTQRKAVQRVQQLVLGSKYAAPPTRQKSSLLEQVVRFEASIFRQVADDGCSKDKIEGPECSGPNNQGGEGLFTT